MISRVLWLRRTLRRPYPRGVYGEGVARDPGLGASPRPRPVGVLRPVRLPPPQAPFAVGPALWSLAEPPASAGIRALARRWRFNDQPPICPAPGRVQERN